jgi:hypothetical protein
MIDFIQIEFNSLLCLWLQYLDFITQQGAKIKNKNNVT